jgi:KDEL-tailed cysteine endopeptidase
VVCRFYKEGIFSGVCEKELNHGVLAVGYGVSDQGDYW